VSGVKQKASAKADSVKQSATAKKQEVAGKAREAAPESARGAALRAQQFAQENPVPLAIAVAFVAGLVLGRRRSR
jgi:ElaB/YqjD/DUF883 family membrane-anchored ribosome-binding protein